MGLLQDYTLRHELGLPTWKVRRWLHEQSLGEGNIFWNILTHLSSHLPLPSNMEELVWRLSQEQHSDFWSKALGTQNLRRGNVVWIWLRGTWQALLMGFCDAQLMGYLFLNVELERMTSGCRWELDLCCSHSTHHQRQLQGNLSWILMMNIVGIKSKIQRKKRHPQKNAIKLWKVLALQKLKPKLSRHQNLWRLANQSYRNSGQGFWVLALLCELLLLWAGLSSFICT